MEVNLVKAHDDRHLSCTPITVDEEGWEQLVELLAGTLESVIEIQAGAATRLAESGAPGLRATVSILGFESPEVEVETTPR